MKRKICYNNNNISRHLGLTILFLVFTPILMFPTPITGIRKFSRFGVKDQEMPTYDDGTLRKRATQFFRPKEADLDWLSKFKTTFLRKLNLKKLPHFDEINKTKIYEKMPNTIKTYVKNLIDENMKTERHSDVKFSSFINAEGYHTRLGNDSVQLAFFRLPNDILNSSIIKARIIMEASDPTCTNEKVNILELFPTGSNGNSKMLEADFATMARYHIENPLDTQNKFRMIASQYLNRVNGDTTLTIDATSLLIDWLEEFENDNEEFYKAIVISCSNCKCGPQIIDENKILLEYTYSEPLSENERVLRNKRDSKPSHKYVDLTQDELIKQLSPHIRNECTHDIYFTSCCVQRLVINVTELGWDDWIIYPHILSPNICSGACKYKIRPDTVLPAFADSHRYDRDLQSEYTNSIKSCCYPSKFETQYIYYLDEGGRFRIAEYDDFSVVECSCS